MNGVPNDSGLKAKNTFLLFLFYSIIGWIYEEVLEVFVYQWGFSNRGVLVGPYCPIYGVGAFVFALLFYKNVKQNNNLHPVLKLAIIFFGCMIAATGIELITSYILEFFTGHWPWETYRNYKYNFQGRIALSTSIRFGIGGVIMVYYAQPLLHRVLNCLKGSIDVVFLLTFTAFICDIAYLLLKIFLF